LDGTRLEALFSGRWEKKILRDSHGRIFLDVNPVCFQAIVDYLTEMLISSEDNLPKLLPIVDDEHKDIMKHQIELFGLFSHKQSLSNSSIIKERTHIEQLHNWLNEDGSDGELGLLYRGSRDGFTSKDFHDTCDNKGPTLTIVKTKDGYVLGGYSNTSWSIYEFPGEVRVIYKKADKAFLFLLTDSDGIHAPYKMKLNSYGGGDAICHSSGEAGPTFGSGHDLYVSLHANDPTLNLWLGKGGSYISSDIPEQLTSPGSGYKTLPIEEIEVYQVSSNESTKEQIQENSEDNNPINMDDINTAIITKRKSLLSFESDIQYREDSFNDEQSFITSFTSGETKDIITLNVNGTTMATTRATLCTAEESSLAQQFDDTKWTEQGCSNLRVKEWTPDDVCDWAKKVEGIQEDVGSILKENNITGCELLTLNMDGLNMIGIERAGTLCLLLEEIKKLKQSSQEVVTLIEHSPYCFGKILDYLRMKQIHSEGLVSSKPPLPTVCDSQKERFRKVVPPEIVQR